MGKIKLVYLTLAGALISAMALLSSCLPTAETETDGGDFTTSIWPMVIFIVLLFAMMYFLMIRPQRKRQREQQDLLDQLHRGDKVITAGGIHGEVDSVSDDSVVIKVESGATMRVAKASVIQKQMPPEAKIG